ncbi:hypothetical protein Lal_00020494 [Lupinus albus]|nr:hypothetical protein Lal_00020494 [Lupinus albus]
MVASLLKKFDSVIRSEFGFSYCIYARVFLGLREPDQKLSSQQNLHTHQPHTCKNHPLATLQPWHSTCARHSSQANPDKNLNSAPPPSSHTNSDQSSQHNPPRHQSWTQALPSRPSRPQIQDPHRVSSSPTRAFRAS